MSAVPEEQVFAREGRLWHELRPGSREGPVHKAVCGLQIPGPLHETTVGPAELRPQPGCPTCAERSGDED